MPVQEPISRDVDHTKIPDVEIPLNKRPVHLLEPMPIGKLCITYASYMWYDYEGRLLAREEVHDILAILYGQGARFFHYMYDGFQDPKNLV